MGLAAPKPPERVVTDQNGFQTVADCRAYE